MTLNQYLRESRIKAGLKQGEVAKVLGYTSSQFVSNWERGLCSPPYETLNELVKLYKISPRKLIDLILEAQKEKLVTALKPSLKKHS